MCAAALWFDFQARRCRNYATDTVAPEERFAIETTQPNLSGIETERRSAGAGTH